MSVLKELYNHVKTNVTLLSSIKHFDYWNENIQNQDVATSYQTPAVFFEYSTIEWIESTKGSFEKCTDKTPPLQGYAEFTLHIVIRKNESSDIDTSELRHFDVINDVYKSVQWTTFDQIEGHIERKRDQDDINHNALRDWQMTFGCNVLESGETNIGNTIIDANDPVGTIDAEINVDPQVDMPFIGGNGIKFNLDN